MDCATRIAKRLVRNDFSGSKDVQVAETVFLAIFTVELLLRFIAERHRFFWSAQL